jgi:hypothetical protein
LTKRPRAKVWGFFFAPGLLTGLANSFATVAVVFPPVDQIRIHPAPVADKLAAPANAVCTAARSTLRRRLD